MEMKFIMKLKTSILIKNYLANYQKETIRKYFQTYKYLATISI